MSLDAGSSNQTSSSLPSSSSAIDARPPAGPESSSGRTGKKRRGKRKRSSAAGKHVSEEGGGGEDEADERQGGGEEGQGSAGGNKVDCVDAGEADGERPSKTIAAPVAPAAEANATAASTAPPKGRKIATVIESKGEDTERSSKSSSVKKRVRLDVPDDKDDKGEAGATNGQKEEHDEVEGPKTKKAKKDKKKKKDKNRANGTGSGRSDPQHDSAASAAASDTKSTPTDGDEEEGATGACAGAGAGGGEPLSEAARQAIHYVQLFKQRPPPQEASSASASAAAAAAGPATWKFSKARQNWLIRHFWDVEVLPRRSAKGEGEGDDNVDGAAAEEGEDVVHLVVDYLKTVKGRARQDLIDRANKLLEEQVTPAGDGNGNAGEDRDDGSDAGGASEGQVAGENVTAVAGETATPVVEAAASGDLTTAPNAAESLEERQTRSRLLLQAMQETEEA